MAALGVVRGRGRDSRGEGTLVEVTGWRTQWAVGQGSFHSGAVRALNRPVHYVYDCGTQPAYQSALDREIDIALSRLQGRIDVLYISHFHEDHVSGVRDLLDRAKVKRVVLPLTPATDRVMALAFALGTEDGRTLPEWYFDLIANPRDFFESAGATVTEVEPGAGDDVAPVEFPIEPDDNAQPDFSPPKSGRQPSGAASAALADGHRPAWLWVPWASSRADAARGAFLSEMGSLLGKNPDEVRRLLEDPRELKTLGTERGSWLRQAYNVAVGGRDLNFTTMALYSGPPPHAPSAGWASGYFEANRPLSCIHRPEVGWLGTGDAELGTRPRASEFNRAIAPLRPNVGTLVLPHHGSDHNNSDALLSAFNPGTTFVATADIYRNWRQPGPETTRNALMRGHPVWVRSEPSTRWTEHFAIDT